MPPCSKSEGQSLAPKRPLEASGEVWGRPHIPHWPIQQASPKDGGQCLTQRPLRPVGKPSSRRIFRNPPAPRLLKIPVGYLPTAPKKLRDLGAYGFKFSGGSFGASCGSYGTDRGILCNLDGQLKKDWHVLGSLGVLNSNGSIWLHRTSSNRSSPWGKATLLEPRGRTSSGCNGNLP